MDTKDTMLLFRTPASEEVVQPNTYVVVLNTSTRQLNEYLPGQPIPRTGAPNIHVYTVPARPCKSVFAILDAITCSTPAGRAFRPGFCINMSLSYISPLGLRTLLLDSTARDGCVPAQITLGNLYDLLLPRLKEACEQAAISFSGGKMLPYVQWWQELNHGDTYVQSLKTALIAAFNTYGFALDNASVRITGISGIPV